MTIFKTDNFDELITKLHSKHWGLYDIPDTLYHHPDCPGMSRSALNEFAKSGQHYWQYKLRHKEPTDAMKLGSLFHISILRPENLNLECGVLPKFKGVRGNTIAQQRDAHIAQRSERLWITQDQLDAVQRMTVSIVTHPIIKEVRECQHVELSVFNEDPQTKQMIKAKPDAFCIKDGKIRIYDIKSCKKGGGTAHEFMRAVTNTDSRLYIQAAMTSYLLHLTLGLPIEFFKFVVVEKEPPYPVSIFQLTDDFMNFAMDTMSMDLEDFAICKEKNIWPGYPEGTQTLELPSWMLKQ